jgi:hypothetical protein
VRPYRHEQVVEPGMFGENRLAFATSATRGAFVVKLPLALAPVSELEADHVSAASDVDRPPFIAAVKNTRRDLEIEEDAHQDLGRHRAGGLASDR